MAGHPKAGEVIDALAGHYLLSITCSGQIERVLLAKEDGEHEAGWLGSNATGAGEEDAKLVVEVCLVELAQAQPFLVEQVVRDPLLLLKHFDRALVAAQHYMKSKHPRGEDMTVKPNAKARVYGIPGARLNNSWDAMPGRSLVSPSVGELRACMASRLVCVSGTITKLGSPHLVEYKQQYECNRCHSRFEVDVDIHAGGHVQLPEVCPNDAKGRRRKKRLGREFQGSQGSSSRGSQEQPQSGCQGTNFTRCEENQYHKDCQELRLQEWNRQLGGSRGSSTGRESAGGNKTPKSITVRLEDDLVDKFRPGDEVQVTGILIQHWKKIGKIEMQCEVELLINAVHVVHLNKKRLAAVEAPSKPSLASGRPTGAGNSAELQGRLPGRSPSAGGDLVSLTATPADDSSAWVARHWSTYASKPLAGRDLIVGSLSPQVHGLYIAKLAVMLVLCGGVPLRGASGKAVAENEASLKAKSAAAVQDQKDRNHSVRGECHLLLAGDPGTGKSQLMRCAARLSARSVVTNGRGSTNAGLTATAVVSRGDRSTTGGGARGKLGKRSEWTLEAGALVLADGGLCCIDEFETMRESDRAAIHEAMEQQTLSIAKAGLVTKLRSQTAIIASTNIKKPKSGRKQSYDPFTTGFDENMVNISAPLLSRFDLVLTVRDLSLKEWDSLIADHVLHQHSDNSCGSQDAAGNEYWSQEKMKSYVAYVRKLNPVMTKDAENVLKLYYQRQRQLSASESNNRPSARTTIRMLESLVRLSQAHARLMAREQVRLQDAVAAICLMEASMKNSLILGVQNVTQSLAPRDPDEESRKMEQMLLASLGILDDCNGGPGKRKYLTAAPLGDANLSQEDFGGEEEEDDEFRREKKKKELWGDRYDVWSKENNRR
ncbi:minichromosome maintenance protein [Chloropicon primus]|uniref:DNA helicase n=1 Tax=Chloropicon primus TaxID=1764295 RepID=A0A5B8MZV7_9CHLO|nr:minichromosome maintenance protein [Chloropicon primus]UPR04203.1 minichromosome maintenance protein [Chloropicon primus]|mmetsp:Transcript_13529/g.38030  ORF Transcript_13529/g.38030 Transcript_13529/m.38030 type:complete len:884 (+) Transcript_13529:329-2980(+)|eukprot:QDZ24994.1 minichromosome maintenance protein [Chloropicon primus]